MRPDTQQSEAVSRATRPVSAQRSGSAHTCRRPAPPPRPGPKGGIGVSRRAPSDDALKVGGRRAVNMAGRRA
eukprot:3063580-Prymnesium_polylepis.2